jgi:hypothetical protein
VNPETLGPAGHRERLRTRFAKLASDLITQLLEEDQPKTLSILGPTFTGSLKSLSDLLECRGEKAPSCLKPVQIVSGTVTGTVQLGSGDCHWSREST